LSINNTSNPPPAYRQACTPPEAVKKLLQIQRAGGDIEKALQRYLIGLTPHDEKLQ